MAKEVSVIPNDSESGYLAILQDEDAQLAIKENMGGSSIDPFMLPRVRIPTGGSTVWAVPDVDGEMSGVKELSGVIVYQTTWRAYWKDTFGGGNQPPDCSSRDGVYGVGDPGGECATCPLNKFGSDERGRGKACKEMKAVFVLREGDVIPTLVAVPPSSLRDMQNFMLTMANRGKPYWKLVTGLKLNEASNRDQIKYSKISARMLRALSPAEVEEIAEYRKGVIAIANNMQITQGDVLEGDGPLPFE